MSSKQAPSIISSSNTPSSTPHDTDLTPSPTSSDDRDTKYNISITMESNKPEIVEESKHKDDVALPNDGEPATGDAEEIQKETPEPISKKKVKCTKGRKDKQKKVKKVGKKASPVDSASDSSSEDSSSSSDDSSDSDSDEEDKKSKRQKSKWKQALKKMMAKKMAKKYKKATSDTSSESDSSSDSSDSDSSSEEESQRKRRKKKSKKAAETSDDSEEEAEVDEPKVPVEETAAPVLDTDIKLKDIATFLQLLTQQSAIASPPPAPPAVQVATPASPSPARPRTRRELVALKLAKQKELAEATKVNIFSSSKAFRRTLKCLNTGILLSRLNRI